MVEIREPAVAGAFYNGMEKRLIAQIDNCYVDRYGVGKIPELSTKRDNNLIGVVNPHAGVMYSGPVATFSFNEIAKSGFPETFILIGPNHTGLGSDVAIGTNFGLKVIAPFMDAKVMIESIKIDSKCTFQYYGTSSPAYTSLFLCAGRCSSGEWRRFYGQHGCSDQRHDYQLL